MPYGYFDRIYQYQEGRGVFTQVVANYLRDNTLYLLPIRAKSFELLKSAGVVKNDIVGWPHEFVIDYGLPEGFFKVGHPWSYTVNPDTGTANPVDHRFYDPVYQGASGNMPPRPDIEHVYEDTVRYDVSQFGVRFAMNLYDRVRLGEAKWNQRMKDMMKRRIDAYAMQLNQMIWDYRKTAYLVDRSNTNYTQYSNPAFNHYDTLGSVPFFINGLICRFGVLHDQPNRPTSNIGSLPVVALTFHNGDYTPEGVPAPLRVGQDRYIHWSVMPVFFHTDLYKINTSNGQKQVLTVLDLAQNGLYDDGSYLRRHVVGTHERGIIGMNAAELFDGPSGGVSNLKPENFLAGAYWQLFTPALLSPHWNTTITTNLSHITPGHVNRVLEVYRRTKIPTVYASRVQVTIPYFNNNGNGIAGQTTVVTYPIYGFDNPVRTNPATDSTLGWTIGGVDTRAPISAAAMEYVYYSIAENEGGSPPELIITRPEIHASLNLMAITTPTFYKEATSRQVARPQFGGEFSDYKDAKVKHDLVAPRGVIFMGRFNSDTVQFAFDDQNFDVEFIPLPAAVQYFQGFFAMKMMLINPQPWGLIWGVREATPGTFLSA